MPYILNSSTDICHFMYDLYIYCFLLCSILSHFADIAFFIKQSSMSILHCQIIKYFFKLRCVDCL